MSMPGGAIGTILLLLLGITLLGLIVAFVLVPLFKGIGWIIGGLFSGLAWVIRHVFEFVAGMLKDAVRLVGALIAWVVMVPLVLVNVIIGRWSAAGHFWRSMHRECKVGTTCLYRVVLQRPLRFLLLDGLLEGLEERVNEAMAAAPTADKPRRRSGQFQGYTIVGSLPSGGSGAKLYVAEPEAGNRHAQRMPRQVVIKSMAVTEGSTLPQILRESRALEAARQLGIVLDHGMDDDRFFYVMPYHRGEHLGIVTRQFHGESGSDGLGRRALGEMTGYVADLLRTLVRYHEGGLWHKDVKPDNIIIHDGRAHLVDLGLVTPLRSAMTLTTHGTEYFRDPEMVRMALRGVKVHQVDGAKFDVYAVGAVLYFVMENTFPAHGGLSAFARKSPESLRWIVCRAMTDYNKRYETARTMLADVEHVLAASDPWTVKPAELPSMRGQAPPEPAGEPSVTWPEHVVASAGSPRPPPGPEPTWQPAGAVAGVAGPGAAPVDRPDAGRSPARTSRPRFRVTNWWTGAYQVEDPDVVRASEEASSRLEARSMRRHASEFRAEAEGLRQQVRQRAISARQAAREQIRAARTRAKEIRRRAREHQLRAPIVAVRRGAGRARSRQPSGALAGFVILLIALPVLFMVRSNSHNRSASESPQQALAVRVEAPGMLGRTLLLVNDHPSLGTPELREKLEGIIQARLLRGQVVRAVDPDDEARIRTLLPSGALDDEAGLSEGVIAELERLGFDGLLRIDAAPGDSDAIDRMRETTILVPKE